jgi:hypothetical protein
MAAYSVLCKIIRGSQGAIEADIEDYINSLETSQTIRGIACAPYGSDNILAIIVHDS